MKELLDRINVFELKVREAVNKIDRLKNENEILIQENFRLKEEINQLSNQVKKGLAVENRPAGDEARDKQIKLNIEQVKEELDQCLIDLTECIEMVVK